MKNMYREAYRPQFHFTSAKGWINDPNGLVYYKGEYHLFFQHNPFGNEWGNMTWGHAVSRDLLHWEQLPNAIEPDALGTIFSGSAVVDWRNMTGFQCGREKPMVAIFTSAGSTSAISQGRLFTQSIAWSNDRGRTWTKYEGNPVLDHVRAENRDPTVVWHAPTSQWIMALYLDENDYALFSSPDLKHWSHLHTLTVPGCRECPDFFEMSVAGDPVTKRWVFTGANGRYVIGRFNGKRFRIESGPHQVDFGRNFYAVQTFSDVPERDGRRIQIAWMNGGQYPGMPFNQQMSFPCELTLRSTPEGLRLYRNPVREVRRLYRDTHYFRRRLLPYGVFLWSPITASLLDIQCEVDVKESGGFRLQIGEEAIIYSRRGGGRHMSRCFCTTGTCWKQDPAQSAGGPLLHRGFRE